MDEKIRVSAGAKWLDDNFPGWAKLINLTDLEMTSCSRCVCGQLDDHFSDISLGSKMFSREFGFSPMRSEKSENHSLWVEEIKRRKEGDYQAIEP